MSKVHNPILKLMPDKLVPVYEDEKKLITIALLKYNVIISCEYDNNRNVEDDYFALLQSELEGKSNITFTNIKAKFINFSNYPVKELDCIKFNCCIIEKINVSNIIYIQQLILYEFNSDKSIILTELSNKVRRLRVENSLITNKEWKIIKTFPNIDIVNCYFYSVNFEENERNFIKVNNIIIKDYLPKVKKIETFDLDELEI